MRDLIKEMNNLFNIELSPLRSLLERRLQTLAITSLIVIHIFLAVISAGLVYFFIVYTELWWICTLYMIWSFSIDTDIIRSSKRRSEWMKNWTWWKYAKNYFPVKLVKVSKKEFSPERNYLLCGFPHGLLCSGIVLTLVMNTKNLHKIFPYHTVYTHTLKCMFYLPFMREVMISLGNLPASEECLNRTMGAYDGGNISCLMVGGAEEALYFNPGVHKILLKSRKGFIRIALRNGCSLVPVYSFGENEIYGQYKFKDGSFMREFQKIFKKLTGVTFVVMKGRGFFQFPFGVVPHRIPITVVVGEPIDVQKTENPTQEQIDNLHQLFEKKLVELFESQKKYYLKDYETAHLEIC